MKPLLNANASPGLVMGVMLMLTILNGRGTVQAQPQYFTNFFTSVVQSSIPFNSSNNNKAQWVYYPSDFASAPSGNITKIYFRAAPSMLPVICSFTGFTIKMGATNLSTLPPGPWITANMNTVFAANSFQVWPLQGDWMPVTLQTPFPYNNTQNFILEASQTSYSVGFDIMQGNLTARSLYGNISSIMANSQNYLVDFGFDIGIGSTDASLEGFPGVEDTICSGFQPLSVVLKNNGPSTLTSTTIQWKINNLVQIPVSWTGSLAVNATTNVTLGNYNFLPATTYSLVAWSENPNNQPDTYTSNDTLAKNTLYSMQRPAATPASTSYFMCTGDSILISGTLTGTPPWTVHISDGPNTYTLSNLTTPAYGMYFSPSANTTYTIVNVTDASGCDASGSPNSVVVVNPRPTVNLGPDQTIRLSDSITLFSGTTTGTFIWSTGATTYYYVVAGSQYGVGTHPFSVTVTNTYGCPALDTVWITIIDDSGIGENTFPDRLILYPNPANGWVNLQLDPQTASLIVITLINTQGIRVWEKEITPSGKEDIYQLDLSGLAQGIYEMLVTNNISRCHKRLLIIHPDQ